MKAQLRLHKSVDTPKVNMFAKHNNKMYRIVDIQDNVSTLQSVKDASKQIEVETKNLDAYILLVVKQNKIIGELAIGEYEKVMYNTTIECRIIQKQIRVPVGTIVRVNKFPLHYLNAVSHLDLQNIIGRVTDVVNNTYTVYVDDGIKMLLKRNNFVSLGTKDSVNVAYLV